MNLPQSAMAVQERWQRFCERVNKPRACSACNSPHIVWNGRSTRSASVRVGEEVVHLTDIVCRRVRCVACRFGWQLRPPGLMPRRHYQLCVVASATSQYLFDEGASQERIAAQHGCSRRTLGRWLRWLSRVADPAVLGQKIAAAVGAPLLPRLEEVRRRVRSQLGDAQRALLQRAAEVLVLCEALAAAWQLEPPGLRAVVEGAVGGRDRVTPYSAPSIPELARGHPPRE